jgi:gluconate:H+ symporter, GntP family
MAHFIHNLTRSSYWPFAVLIVSVTLVIVMISKWRIHPFVSLMLAAIFVGIASPLIPQVAGEDALITAVELPMAEFGNVAGKIGWVIALAAVIGTAMMESGAAEQIVNWLLRTLGEKRASIALVISGFILSIPVFFDTVFLLLIPLGITLARKTGKNFVMYVVSIGGGAVISHTIVPPTPGPLIMAETFSIELGTVILAGIGAGILPCLVVIEVARRLNKKFDIQPRMEAAHTQTIQNPPSLFLSALPVVVPLIMISLASTVDAIAGNTPGWIAFQGNKNIAMSVGAFISILLWAKTQKLGSNELWAAVAKPMEVSGIIILITSAGGAFGAMIKHSGIGQAISVATEGFSINYILLGWMIAAVMKIAQGSGTVSMITTSAIMTALIGNSVLSYHPIYVLLSVGFGSLFISWMNDSGFWVVVRMSGLTEKEGLKIWTVLLIVISLVGLLQVLLLSWLFPLI